MRVTKEEENFEYRSCWDDDFNVEYAKPGCYVGFEHCHEGVCHNDTTICVCADSMCNDEKYSSEAPPITPGSGLYCYSHHYHGHGPDDGEERWAGDFEECSKGEEFCIEMSHGNGSVLHRGCWSTGYEEGRYNFTGCEVRT